MASTEELVKAVRRERVLYDTAHPDYMKGKLKEDIWANIANAIQYKDGNAAKEAWLKLRNCHRDALRRQKRLKRSSGSHAGAIKPWKYQQQMEFLVPYMAQRETNPNAPAGDDSGAQEINEHGHSSGEDTSKGCLNASHECLFPINKYDDDNDDEDDGGSTVDFTVHLRELKKTKVGNTRKKISETVAVLAQFPESYEERAFARKRSGEETDPLYHFFMAMYATTARLPSTSQHTIKMKVFNVVSEAEKIFLGAAFHPETASPPISGTTIPLPHPSPVDTEPSLHGSNS